MAFELYSSRAGPVTLHGYMLRKFKRTIERRHKSAPPSPLQQQKTGIARCPGCTTELPPGSPGHPKDRACRNCSSRQKHIKLLYDARKKSLSKPGHYQPLAAMAGHAVLVSQLQPGMSLASKYDNGWLHRIIYRSRDEPEKYGFRIKRVFQQPGAEEALVMFSHSQYASRFIALVNSINDRMRNVGFRWHGKLVKPPKISTILDAEDQTEFFRRNRGLARIAVHLCRDGSCTHGLKRQTFRERPLDMPLMVQATVQDDCLVCRRCSQPYPISYGPRYEAQIDLLCPECDPPLRFDVEQILENGRTLARSVMGNFLEGLRLVTAGF